ncbi:hypothetical protein [Pedobacter sp. BMA]|uniref:hypothetical protein n=1 Tax=Pedobacter sp. BMA TaxID=1663685 RepID=UPI0006496886|nr:hypothetical protein [Pedobacter sp. BMA]KLT66994.1 hypothetical protein AB669_03475 [Pedobacter sp. BMA]
MSSFTIQEQFDNYLDILNKIHVIDHDIDASINEVEINDLANRRTALKNRLHHVTKSLVNSLNEMGKKYPVQNNLANQTTYIYTEGGKLMFEYH